MFRLSDTVPGVAPRRNLRRVIERNPVVRAVFWLTLALLPIWNPLTRID